MFRSVRQEYVRPDFGRNKNKKEMSFKTFGDNDSKEHL